MLKDQIKEDLIIAMKGGDDFSVVVLRGVNAALHNKSIEKRGKGEDEELSDDEVLDVLNKEVKKRKEAVVLYKEGGREELADKEQKELVLLQKYLPEQMSREEVEKKIEEILAGLETKDFGAAMKAVMAELKGKADGKEVAEIIKEKLG